MTTPTNLKAGELTYEVGKIYTIDAGYRNSGTVELISFEKYYCHVRCTETGSEWDTMLNRLSL